MLQGFNADSGRTANGIIRRGSSGISNPAYGTLVGGRVNTLSLDDSHRLRSESSAYAFSPFGYSGSYAGFGDTELARPNTAVKYDWNSQISYGELPRRRLGAMGRL